MSGMSEGAQMSAPENKIQMLIDEIRAEADALSVNWMADPEGTKAKLAGLKICDGGCIAISPVPPCSGCCVRCSSN